MIRKKSKSQKWIDPAAPLEIVIADGRIESVNGVYVNGVYRGRLVRATLINRLKIKIRRIYEKRTRQRDGSRRR